MTQCCGKKLKSNLNYSTFRNPVRLLCDAIRLVKLTQSIFYTQRAVGGDLGQQVPQFEQLSLFFLPYYRLISSDTSSSDLSNMEGTLTFDGK